MTTTTTKTQVPDSLDLAVLQRTLEEGYGPGAWHGADLRAAIADVPADLAFWRPGAGRHNIAEITLHHAFYVRAVRGQLTGAPQPPFAVPGEDWFPAEGQLTWDRIRGILEAEQAQLATAVPALPAGGPAQERFDLVLGITCHAVYHAGQVQLVKALRAGEGLR